MELKTYKTNFPIVEFQHFIDDVSTPEEIRFNSVLDILFNNEVTLEAIDDCDLSIFVIETNFQTYVFSGYDLIECYVDEDNGNLVHATFVK